MTAKITGAIAALILWVLSTAPAFAALPRVDQSFVTYFLETQKERRDTQQASFETELAQVLSKDSNIGKAADFLAVQHRAAVADMRSWVELWLLWVRFEEDYAWKKRKLSWEEEQDFEREMQAAAASIIHRSHHLPIFVESGARLFLELGERCSTADFREIVAGATDPVATGWLAADSADYCYEWWVDMAAMLPNNTAVLFRLVKTGSLSLAERIAALEDVRGKLPADKTDNEAALDVFLVRNLVIALFDGGLVREGLAIVNSLLSTERRLLESNEGRIAEVEISGYVVRAQIADVIPGYGRDREEIHTELAAAMYVTGNAPMARKLLAEASYGEQAKKAFQCQLALTISNYREGNCGYGAGFEDWVFMNWALNHSSDDPYDLVEKRYGFNGSSALWVEVVKRSITEANYQDQVIDLAKRWRPDRTYQWNERSKAFRAVMNPMLLKRIDQLDSEFTDRVRGYGGYQADERRYERESVPAPKSAHFPEHKLTACRASASAKRSGAKIDLRNLPDGYRVVRAEQSGDTIAAISLSQNYDPAGEVSGGGYWVHLSSDGGKTWEKPYYTGLAQFFPYVVPSESCLPLIAGDKLQLEVEIREIDTASIIYPPVGTRSRRIEKGLYLDLPLAELRMDTDGDGLTDIAEEGLLLDPGRADTDGDKMPDTQDSFPNVAYSGVKRPTDGAMTAVLNELFKAGFGAIIEAPDRPPGTVIGDFSGPAMSLDRPIFLQGNKPDFGGFAARQMTLVYGPDDLAKFRATKPDFHAIYLSPLTLNRAGTRGFIEWSAGWTGGTYRVVREGEAWRVEVISGWIT